MMNPKAEQIAKDLIEEFEEVVIDQDDMEYDCFMSKREATQCAIICVNRIMETIPFSKPLNLTVKGSDNEFTIEGREHWQQVKTILESN